MERFIEFNSSHEAYAVVYLKSSMERFIGGPIKVSRTMPDNLKSSMERFIVKYSIYILYAIKKFKIQYGEIYSI